MKITAILHATFLSSDLERSKAFYEGLLDLRPSAERPDLGYPGVWYEVAENQQIHLMLLPNPETGLQRPAHGGRDRHVALAVDDLEELRERLERAAIPHTMSKSGRRALFCRDPDDNALEFVEAT